MKLYTLVCETERNSYVIKINYYNEEQSREMLDRAHNDRHSATFKREESETSEKGEEGKKKKKGNFATDSQLKAARG